jgi:hypothetical protein
VEMEGLSSVFFLHFYSEGGGTYSQLGIYRLI